MEVEAHARVEALVFSDEPEKWLYRIKASLNSCCTPFISPSHSQVSRLTSPHLNISFLLLNLGFWQFENNK